MTPDDFRLNMETGNYWITRCIAQGAFPNSMQGIELRKSGVTDIFNVGTAASILSAQTHGFQQVVDLPVEDLRRLPDAYVLDCLDRFHAALSQPGRKIYIHCVAGQNRSPAMLWLYLVACGTEPGEAKALIEDRTLDAVAGHPKLVDDALVQTVQAHGKSRFLPLPRPDVLVPA